MCDYFAKWNNQISGERESGKKSIIFIVYNSKVNLKNGSLLIILNEEYIYDDYL